MVKSVRLLLERLAKQQFNNQAISTIAH